MTEADSLGFEHNLETVVVFISPEHGNYAGTKETPAVSFRIGQMGVLGPPSLGRRCCWERSLLDILR